jgi:hypothetical protein
MFPIYETPSGSTNGTNRLFVTAADYKPGSVRVHLNGLLLRKDLTDGWAELGAKRIRLNEAPHVGDVVRVYYIPLV